MKAMNHKFFFQFILLLLLIMIPVIQVIAGHDSIKISIWTINQPGSDAVGNWIENKISEFEKANPNIIVVHSFWENQSYKIKLKVAMFSGDGPDILYNWGGESQLMFSREGLLYDLTDDLGKDKWGLSPGMFATHNYKGRVYGIPIFPTVDVIWYNKEIFTKHGWKAPQTWDEFLLLCKQIKAKGYIPIAMGGQEPWTILHPYMDIVDRIGGSDLYLRAKARKIKFTHPDFVSSFQVLQNLAQKDYLPPEVTSINYTEATQLMIQNNAVMMFMGDWQYSRLTNQMTQDFNKWDFFPFPVFPGGKGLAKNAIGAVDGFSIKNSPNSKTAVKFLKFLASRQSLIEIYQKSGFLVALASPYMGKNARPQLKGIASLLANASSLTQWWDQDLPESTTQNLLNSLQDLLSGNCSPQKAGEMIEAAYEKKSR